MNNRYLKNVATLKLDAAKCTGCGMCIDVCPHNVFLLNSGKAGIINPDACMECGACAKNCRFSAITVNAGVGCAAAMIQSLIKGGQPDCGGSGAGNCCSGSGSGCC